MCCTSLTYLKARAMCTCSGESKRRWPFHLQGCGEVGCQSFQCRLGRLRQGDKVEIKLTSRLWQNTLLKVINVIVNGDFPPPHSLRNHWVTTTEYIWKKLHRCISLHHHFITVIVNNIQNEVYIFCFNSKYCEPIKIILYVVWKGFIGHANNPPPPISTAISPKCQY